MGSLDNSEDIPISKSEEVAANKIINDSLGKLPIPKTRKPKTVKQQEYLYDALNARIEEYMDSYILLGFSADGDDMQIINIRDNIQKRALRDLLESFLSRGEILND